MDKLIGKRISQARNSRNLTQEDLAELSGLSVSSISRIETGYTSTSLKTLYKICNILDVGLDCIFYDILPNRKNISDPIISDILALPENMSNEQKFMYETLLNDISHNTSNIILLLYQQYKMSLN